MLDEPLQLVLPLLLMVQRVQQVLGQRHGDFSETFQGLEIWLRDKNTFSHWKEALKGSRPFKNPLNLLHGTDLCGVGDGNLNLGEKKIRFFEEFTMSRLVLLV